MEGPYGRGWMLIAPRGGKAGKKGWRVTFSHPLSWVWHHQAKTREQGDKVTAAGLVQPLPWGMGSLHPPWGAAVPASILPVPCRIWACGRCHGSWQEPRDGV